MIKVLVPATHGSKERRESSIEWVSASPHVDKEYPIWPDGCANLNDGVILSRVQNELGQIIGENGIKISAHGGTRVLVGGKSISEMKNDEVLSVAEDVYVRRHLSQTFIIMGEKTEGCVVEVLVDERYWIPRAKLVRVIGAEADKIRKKEDRVNSQFWGPLEEGTSDFSSPAF